MKYRMKRHAVQQPLSESFRYIPLTQGQNAIVDAEDFEWLSQWNWYAQWNPETNSFYARRGFKPPIHMSHAILHCIGHKQPVDHENHDTLDNRKRNLRKCTYKKNAANRRMHINNVSGLKGVCWHKGHRKWSAQIMIHGKRKYLGFFQSAKEAAQAYDRAAREYFKEFAYVNFPLEVTPQREEDFLQSVGTSRDQTSAKYEVSREKASDSYRNA